MPEVKITLSANAGVCIQAAGKKIWVDALFSGADVGFSPMSPELAQRVLASETFAEPDHIVYTHCHPDHYSRNLAQRAKDKWPTARVYLPEPEIEGQVLLSGNEMCITDGGLTLRFLRLPHEGAQYTHVKHYGLLLTAEGCNILLPGDCALGNPVLAQAVGGQKIHIAVMDFPWITLRSGRAFLEQYVRPDHLIAHHLPFAKDDKNGYRISAAKAAQSMKNDVHLLLEPMQTEIIKI